MNKSDLEVLILCFKAFFTNIWKLAGIIALPYSWPSFLIKSATCLQTLSVLNINTNRQIVIPPAMSPHVGHVS